MAFINLFKYMYAQNGVIYIINDYKTSPLFYAWVRLTLLMLGLLVTW